MGNFASMESMQNSGWNFDISHSNDPTYWAECGTSTWYGYKYGYDIGSVYATLVGSGTATLNFGNCYSGGRVTVYLNGRDIAYAVAYTFEQEVTFDYSSGDILTIKEDPMAIIKLNSLKLSCADSK